MKTSAELHRKLLVPNKGKGAELMALLTKELGIPPSTQWFEVRFETDKAVVVRCEYRPEELP